MASTFAPPAPITPPSYGGGTNPFDDWDDDHVVTYTIANPSPGTPWNGTFQTLGSNWVLAPSKTLSLKDAKIIETKIVNTIDIVQKGMYEPVEQPRCFAGPTPVRMADGTEKAIADVVVGDVVAAFDGLGELAPATVTHVHAHGEEAVVELAADGTSPIRVTPLHRFLTESGDYKPLARLGSGERLVAADGRAVGDVRVSGGDSRVRVYNLTVDKFHTYVAGGFRVHNQKPVVVDLDGDNRIELIGLEESGVLFDMDEDGFAENTAWVSPDDGLLAFDRDGDGRITHAREFAFALYGAPGASDLDGLRAAFDTNGDGVLDVNDAEFARFGVWRDADQDGVTDAGEFRSLVDLGIASIGLSATGPAVAENGNTILGQGSFTRADGSSGLLADVDLAVDGNGFAEVQRTALKSVLTDEAGNTAGAVAANARLRLLNAASTGGVAFGSAGADVLYTTGATAATLVGGAGDDVLKGADGADVLRGGLGADVLSAGAGDDTLWVDAADLTRGVDGGSGLDTLRVATTEDVTVDMGAAYVEYGFGNAGADTFRTSADWAFAAHGGGGADTLRGGAGNDILHGDAGADVLSGGGGDDELHIDAADRQADIDGGAGADLVVVEGSGSATFDAGAGNVEYVLGGAGADTLWTGTSTSRATAAILTMPGKFRNLKDMRRHGGGT